MLLELLRLLLEQKLLRQMLALLLELELQLLELVQVLELLLFYRKQPKRLLTGKRARVIFSY